MVTKYQFFKILILGPGGRRRFDADHSVSEYLKFEDLIKQMLEWDPLKRIKPDQILKHEFFKKKIEEMDVNWVTSASTVDSGGAGGARAPPEFGGSEKGQRMLSAYRSLANTTNTPGSLSATRSSACPARTQRAQKWNNLDSIAAIWS